MPPRRPRGPARSRHDARPVPLVRRRRARPRPPSPPRPVDRRASLPGDRDPAGRPTAGAAGRRAHPRARRRRQRTGRRCPAAAADEGAAVVIATHDRAFAEAVADRELRMDAGRLTERSRPIPSTAPLRGFAQGTAASLPEAAPLLSGAAKRRRRRARTHRQCRALRRKENQGPVKYADLY